MRSAITVFFLTMLFSSCSAVGFGTMNAVDRVFTGLPKEFAQSVFRHDWDSATRLQKGGVDINTIGVNGITVLFLSVQARDLPSFRWLLEHGADPNLSPNSGDQISGLCATADDPAFLDLAVRQGMELRVDKRGFSDPITDLLNGRIPLEKFVRYLEQGVNLEHGLPEQLHPLVSAVIQVKYEYAEAMLRHDPTLLEQTALKAEVIHWLESWPLPSELERHEARAQFAEFLRQRYNLSVTLPDAPE